MGVRKFYLFIILNSLFYHNDIKKNLFKKHLFLKDKREKSVGNEIPPKAEKKNKGIRYTFYTMRQINSLSSYFHRLAP